MQHEDKMERVQDMMRVAALFPFLSKSWLPEPNESPGPAGKQNICTSVPHSESLKGGLGVKSPKYHHKDSQKGHSAAERNFWTHVRMHAYFIFIPHSCVC